MEHTRKMYRVYFFGLLTVIIGIIVFTFVMLRFNTTDNIKLLIGLLLSMLSLGVIFWFQPRIVFYGQQYRFFRLKSMSRQSIKVPYNPFTEAFITRLQRLGYKIYQDEGSYVSLYKITRDKSFSLVTQRGVIEVFIMIRDHQLSFTDQQFVKLINRLENQFQKEFHFKNYAIFQIKRTDLLTDDQISLADQITFDRQGKVNVSVINAYYDTTHQSLYFLHSKNYFPTPYYEYAVQTLLKSIKK